MISVTGLSSFAAEAENPSDTNSTVVVVVASVETATVLASVVVTAADEGNLLFDRIFCPISRAWLEVVDVSTAAVVDRFLSWSL